jgi:Mlc titration factor MtfA (ptsG expression regulator)
MLQQVIVLALLVLFVLFVIFYKRPGRKITLPADYKQLLLYHVAFYRRLSEENKIIFEEKLKDFLRNIRIEGVNTTVSELDKLLVASSGVIPVFGFVKWKYNNLDSVLLYPSTFNRQEFLASGFEKDTLGMVGNGPMQRIMILSKPALYEGFNNETSNYNTGIHEFVHLLDKEDGDVDGLPESLLDKQYREKWNEVVYENTQAIIKGESDISSYAATNKAEFFSVSSEYFFNNPSQMKQNHPEIYDLLAKIFSQDPLRL